MSSKTVKSMNRCVLLFSTTLLCGSLSAGLGFADPASPTTAPTTAASDASIQALTDKGLIKKGGVFVLPAEAAVADGIKQLMAAKKKYDDDANVRGEFVAKVEKAKQVLAEYDLEARQQNERLANAKTVRENNEAVGTLNALKSKIDEAERYKQANEEKIAALGDDVRGAYIDLLLTLYGNADEATRHYEELAADADIKAALAGAKAHLGPTPDFKSRLAMLKKMAGGFSADSVKVKHDRGVPTVEVTLNGKTTRWMILDSGASIVTIPDDLAHELNLIPTDRDPVIHCQLADGKMVEARKMTLQSVRLGTFIVENVECAVLPASMVSAQPLLGGTFLKNFIYKLDPNSDEMHLTRATPGPSGRKTSSNQP